jgi:hypothetical protein
MGASSARSFDYCAMEIRGRLESCIDLPAEEAVYRRRYVGGARSYFDLLCWNLLTRA